MLKVDHLDHLVLTVADIEETCEFYERVMGMEIVIFGTGRRAMHFGDQKINIHEAGREYEPKANSPTPGSADLCFIVNIPIKEVLEHLQKAKVPVIEGPVERTGAAGPVISVYFRDPDQNLIEVSNYK
ncbi:MAG TPA: VOC family protein [Balneolales bacterium]|nr:VOC family protein [Balneolales bacterium]